MSTLNFVCEYCNTIFTTETNLRTHTKTAKYCLKLRNLVEYSEECDFCHKQFTQKQSYNRHIKICNSLHQNISKIKGTEKDKIKTLKDELRLNTQTIDELNRTVLNSTVKLSKTKKLLKQSIQQNAAQTIEISKLKEELAYEKGQTDALKNNRPTNIVNKNCNMSSKLSNIQITTIKPFTIEHIAELVPNYTRSHFLRKHQGIVDIIVPFTTLEVDGVMERNIVCTDMSRTICHLLAEDRSWSSDNGLSICSKVVGLFIPKMIEYMKVINDTFNEARKIMDLESDKFTKSKRHADAKKIFDEYFLILEDMNPFYRAAYNKREEYDNLLRVFRDLLKPAIHIRSNRVTEL